MTLENKVAALFEAILVEIRRNPEFAERLATALNGLGKDIEAEVPKRGKGGRRAPAVLDPVAVYQEGDAILRQRLAALDLEQLRDIVAEYGMDPGKLVLKWKTKERVIDHIVDTASARAKKGEAFR
jgi:hypothetical protein